MEFTQTILHSRILGYNFLAKRCHYPWINCIFFARITTTNMDRVLIYVDLHTNTLATAKHALE